MKYQKTWLSYEQQADLLESRGLSFDHDELISHLKSVGYYRLSGYWHIFKRDPEGNDESFVEGANFKDVWGLYVFDRQLKLLTLDAIERVEVYMRNQLSYKLANEGGPFGYLDRSSLPNMSTKDYGHFMSRCFGAYGRSKTKFIDHFQQKYGDSHGLPPYWTLVNIMDFGMMLNLFKGAPNHLKKEIADEIGIPAAVLESWLLTLNTVRNACAHHDRLWNRRLSYKLKIPRSHKYPEWHTPQSIGNDSTFALLTVLGYLLTAIAPESSWHARIVSLIEPRSHSDLKRMGFPDDWETNPMWGRWLAASPRQRNVDQAD